MFWSAVVVLACLGALGVGRVWLRVVVLDRMYRLSQAQSEHDALANEIEKLQLEEAALASASRVDRESQRTLGLRPASSDRTVFVAKSSSGPEESTLVANAL